MQKLKKDDVKKIIEDVDQKLFTFIKDGQYKEILLLFGNLGKYSLTNQIFILMQKQDASTVKGYKEWKKYGRYVKASEKGIKILAPLKEKIERENDDGTIQEKMIVRGYKVAYVYDIKQTDGKDIKPIEMDSSLSVDNKEKIIDALSKEIKKEDYSVSFVGANELSKDCYGLCKHKSKEILILKDMCDLQTISTLIHECAHALAHNPYKNTFNGLVLLPKKDIKEVEAESIACIVCSHLGLDTTRFNFSYISSWADGDINKFRENLDVILKYSLKLIHAIDNYLN